MNSLSVDPLPEYCPDEEFRIHLFKKAVLLFLRGLAAALLMPLDALERLRRGRRVDRHTWFSWFLSAVIYAGGLGTWLLARNALLDGHDRTGPILVCILGLLAAGIISGRLQTRDAVYVSEHRISRRSRWHPHHHHGHLRRRFSEGRAAESRMVDRQPRQQATASGICCGNCRQCQEEICVRTGLAKNRRTK